MSIRWINSSLGTAPANEMDTLEDVSVVDVRDLVDKAGNRADAVRAKIMLGVEYLSKGKKIVVCCDYGISRSNAIAAGILAVSQSIPLDDAVRQVQRATGEMEIKLEPLSAVRKAIDSDTPRNKNAKRTILITGASGFIGRTLCQRLASDFTVISPSHEELDIEPGSTQLSLLVSQHSVDTIIHLANPRVFTSNVGLGKTLTMLRNVLEVCIAHDVALLYPSDWEVYAGYAGTLLADEAMPLHPRGPYGETKYLAELLIEHFNSKMGLRSTIIRSSPVYGPTAKRPKFIYNFIEKAKKSEEIVTHRYLNGNPALDFLHIDDFASAVEAAIKTKYLGTLNIGTGILTSTFDVASMIVEHLDSTSEIGQTLVEAHAPCVAMNYQHAQHSLNWKPQVRLADGLKIVINEFTH